MTYGWAILVVIVAIAALAYFGVRNPGRFLPDSCNIGPGWSCNFKIQPNQVTVVIQNGKGMDMTGFFVNVSGSTCSTMATPLTSFQEGTNQTFVLTPCAAAGTVGMRFKEPLSISYTDEQNFPRLETGQIIGKVEP